MSSVYYTLHFGHLPTKVNNSNNISESIIKLKCSPISKSPVVPVVELVVAGVSPAGSDVNGVGMEEMRNFFCRGSVLHDIFAEIVADERTGFGVVVVVDVAPSTAARLVYLFPWKLRLKLGSILKNIQIFPASISITSHFQPIRLTKI